MNVPRVEKWLNLKSVQIGLRIGFALLMTIVLSQFNLDFLDSTLIDWRMRLSERPKPSSNIVLIGIDSQTLKELKGDPSAEEFGRVLSYLSQAKPRHLVTMLNPVLISGSMPELRDFADTAEQVKLVFLQNDLPEAGHTKLPDLPPPFEKLPVEAGPLTTDRRDGVSRRVILRFEQRWIYPAILANSYNGFSSINEYQGVFDFLNSDQAYVQYRPLKSFPTMSFVDVLDGKFNAEQIYDKIVIIGVNAEESRQVFKSSPFSSQTLDISQLELQAHGIDTLITNDAPRRLNPWVQYILTFFVSLFTAFIVLSLRPLGGILMLFLLVIVFLLISQMAASWLNWLLPMAHPLAAVFISYYFVIPYRLIIENRKSWEYFQKNRLLTQVEELKSNFLRLMSHDLKTPLARIQGMAEVVKQERTRLSDNQLMALDHITQSSEELSDFVASILNLSRIESKEFKLQLKSKDINQLLKEVIRSSEYSARKKNVEIVTELEPMFSLKVDEDLMKQVFSNIVENAIKYSFEGSKILVSTEEIDGYVVAQVADQGVGIDKMDMPLIFEKFYRAQSVPSDSHGTGLGLYLAKYFVELHSGSIDVESEPMKGSTFSVRLPMEFDIHNGGIHV